MLIQVKLLCVIKALVTYIKQRFNSLLWLSVSLLLMLYSMPLGDVNARMILCFVYVFCCLLGFRLYDDLWQSKHDVGKPNRDYTNPVVAAALLKIVWIMMVLLAGVALGVGLTAGLMMASFMVINHVLYTMLITGKLSSVLLPLLKYPFLFLLIRQMMGVQVELNSETINQAMALLLAFTIFEILEDVSFPLPFFWVYPLQILCFVLTGMGCMQLLCILYGAILLSVSLICAHFKWKFAPYVFLLLWLCFKLILTYEIYTS